MSNYWSALRFLSCLGLLSLCTFVALGKCTASKAIPFPKGVADPNGSIGYIANGDGAIEAIDLRTGRALWSRHESARPLLVAGNRLVAGSVDSTSRNTLRISVLDTKNKGKVLYHSNVHFPDWVEIGPANNDSFSMDVSLREVNHQCVVAIEWEAQSSYKGGAPPPEWVEQKNRKTESGVVHVDLDNGKVQTARRPNTTHHDLTGTSLSDQSSWRFEQDAREAFAIGSRVYYLVDSPVETAAGQTALKARDLSTGKLLWQTTLQNRPAVKPPPLRP